MSLLSGFCYGQRGDLLWEENFDTLDPGTWNIVEGDGCQFGINLCGWGNNELQWYDSGNVRVENGHLVLEARRDAHLASEHNGKIFTSGRVNTQNTMSVQYGLIEVRMQTPEMGTGMWPAAWLLGTSAEPWPGKGEIDIMEMGHRRQAMVEAGHSNANLNNFVGSNAIFRHEDACVPGNPTCAAHTSFGQEHTYVAPTSLANRFVTYRLYWTDSVLRFAIVDGNTETVIHESGIGDGMEAFQKPFYMLLNFAIGGFFTDALTNEQVQASLPGQVLVDYVRIYQYNGQGQVWLGDPPGPAPESGTFGVFTDNTPSTNALEAGLTSDIFVWNQNAVDAGTNAPFEGGNVIAWRYFSPGAWFGGSIDARGVPNMSNFGNGSLSFAIRIPADVAFRIGIADVYGNESWMPFYPNESRYGLVRNGEWGQVTIPMADIRGELIALQAMKSLFRIASIDGQFPGTNFDFAIDNVLWEGGGDALADGDGDGIADDVDQCPDTAEGVPVDARGCDIVPVVENVLIQAEDYDRFIDTTLGNAGGQLRGDDVDIESTTDEGGGYNVGWTAPSEMLEFDLRLAAGTYDISARVASAVGGGAYALSVNGEDISLDSVADTGGWQVFETHQLGRVTVPSSGAHTLRMDVLAGYFNINWINLKTVCADPSCMDADGDGVSDAMDQCAGTPPGTAVNAAGCPLPLDSDNDGVIDSLDQCPDTADGTIVDTVGCPFSAGEVTGVEQRGNTSVLFFVNTAGWADVHYSLNNGVNQNFRMQQNNGQNRFAVDGLSIGDVIRYSFTYWNSDHAIDTVVQNYTVRAVQPSPSVTPTPTLLPTPSPIVTPPPLPAPTEIVPLFGISTQREPVLQFDRGDALVTRFADRVRDRHAKENQFQAYDHYLSFYWEHRTAAIEVVDYVAKGGDSVRMNVISQWRLDDSEAENRWFYRGLNTVAEYYDNGTMNRIDDFHYFKERTWNPREGRPIQVGDNIEFEISQFLTNNLPRGRANYYGTTFLYIVGEGIVPWSAVDGLIPGRRLHQEDSFKIDEAAWLGGKTTLPDMLSNEPDNHFMQMATNIAPDNAQPFVLGRRIHHTSFLDGSHDESPENGVFDEMRGKLGPHYINERCSDCHERNGRAAPAGPGQPLDKWVVKVGDAQGRPDPDIGRVLQPKNTLGKQGEGEASIAFWSEIDGLRKPNYQFSNGAPDAFSARIAPPLVGLGLLEAIPESSILALEDVNDSDGDGISGKAQRSVDPVSGDTRLGRFGWKAATSSLKHQIAAAFNTDMGVMTSVLPTPDCGVNQRDCGNPGIELSDEHLNNLVKYVALLGVRPQRNRQDVHVQIGEVLFRDIGCADCHVPTMQTSPHHPFAELRNQTIHPYSDLLLHDMGPGLADSLGEGQASGAEWRTTPLWGIGLSACVTGGVTNPSGKQGDEICTPVHSYLHDGRARSIEEAILWHGGEGLKSKQSFENLSSAQKQTLLRFIESL